MTASSTASAEAAASGKFTHRERMYSAPVLTPTPMQPTHANFRTRATRARLAGVIVTLGCTNTSPWKLVVTRAVHPCRLIRSTYTDFYPASRIWASVRWTILAAHATTQFG